MARKSPYEGQDRAEWPQIAARLAAEYPFAVNGFLSTVDVVWAQTFQLDKFQKELGDLEFALDHGMKPANLPKPFKGLELGCHHFLAVAVARELSRLHPDLWRREEADWGAILRFLPDGQYSLKILVSDDSGGLQNAKGWADESRPSGYVLAIHLASAQSKRFRLRWGWIDRNDWGVVAGRQIVPEAVAVAKMVWLSPPIS
ncbi:MAG: ScaI family restriction endonuclease [Alphaproteobacteria bacterium]|nr:ScaI family restriction endonuclease [Alphaproteobacteria bacterium]